MSKYAMPSEERSRTTEYYTACLENRDELHLDIEIAGDEVVSAKLNANGCAELLKLAQDYREKLTGNRKDIPLPQGISHSELLFKELLLKMKGEWQEPYEHEELCHCRVVATARVGQAVTAGAHTVASVSRRTSAGTGCGTCRNDIQKIIDYRIKKA